MPNQRAEGQKLINLPVGEDFLREIDDAIKKTKYTNRAGFIRDAIVEKLKREGYIIPPELAKAPARIGKGGAQKVESYPRGNTGSPYIANDQHKANSIPEAAREIVRHKAEKVRKSK